MVDPKWTPPFILSHFSTLHTPRRCSNCQQISKVVAAHVEGGLQLSQFPFTCLGTLSRPGSVSHCMFLQVPRALAHILLAPVGARGILSNVVRIQYLKYK